MTQLATKDYDNDIAPAKELAAERGTTRLYELVNSAGKLIRLWDWLELMDKFDILPLYHFAVTMGNFTEEEEDLTGFSPFFREMSIKELMNVCNAYDFGHTKYSLERAAVVYADLELLTKAATVIMSPDFQAKQNGPEGESERNRATDIMFKWGECRKLFLRCMQQVRTSFEDDCKRLTTLYIETKYIDLWKEPRAGWEDVLTKLPQQAADDLTEACRCLGCSRYTAAVVHIGRLFECAFKDFAARHDIPTKYAPANSSWKQIADDIKAHRDSKKAVLSTTEIANYDRVRGQIIIIADLWRNDSVHSTGTFYTDEQALGIYHSIKGLISDLVTL